MKSRLILFAISAAAAQLAHGVSVLNFDGATPTTVSGTPLASTISLQNAYWETVDDNGDDLAIPGFRADTSSSVTVGDPGPAGYGSSAFGDALDGTNGPVMLAFTVALTLSDFGVVLDNSSFGNIPISGGNPAFGTNILFYDASDMLIGYVALDQTVPGFTVMDGRTFENVSKVIFPSGAFYDNLSFNAAVVPEPSAAVLGGISALALLRRRRRA